MRSKVLWAVLIFLLPALACSLGGGSESASSNVSLGGDDTEAAAPTEPPVEEDIEQTQAETPTPEPAGPQSGPFSGTIGLEQFDSYRVSVLLEFTGARGESTGDATTDETQDVLLEVNKNSQAWRQVTKIKAQGGIQADAENESFYINDVTYTKTLGNWIAQDGLLGRSQFSNPGLYAPLPDTAACNAQPEEVNGVSAIRCSFTEADNVAKSLEGAESIQGDVWIAAEGNYVVRYQLKAQNLQLKGLFSGFTEFETYNIDYELLDTNNVAVELPAEAQGTQPIPNPITPGQTSGIAAPDSAQIFVDSPYGMNYFSSADLQTLVDFHRQNLPPAGWQENSAEGYVDDGYALLIFENEEGVLRVFIQQDLNGEGYFVSITLPFEAPDFSGGDTSGGAASASELPLLDDATDVFAAGQVTTYYTASNIPAVVDFYRNQLPAQGWTENTATSFTGDTNALLTFEKEGVTLTVSINQESEGRVNVNLIQQ